MPIKSRSRSTELKDLVVVKLAARDWGLRSFSGLWCIAKVIWNCRPERAAGSSLPSEFRCDHNERTPQSVVRRVDSILLPKSLPDAAHVCRLDEVNVGIRCCEANRQQRAGDLQCELPSLSPNAHEKPSQRVGASVKRRSWSACSRSLASTEATMRSQRSPSNAKTSRCAESRSCASDSRSSPRARK